MPSPATSLFDPTDHESVMAIVRSTLALHAPREAKDREMADLLENRTPIDFPGAIADLAVEVRSGMAAAQMQLHMGLLSEEEKARCFTTTSNEDDKQRAERIEQFDNNWFRILELQHGEVRQHLRFDLLAYGRAWDVQEFMASDMAYDMPKPPKDAGDAKAAAGYSRDREAARKAMGTSTGQLPVIWRHCPTRDVYWREDRGKVTLVIERQWRYVKDLLEDARYAKQLPKLRAWVKQQLGTGGKAKKSDINSLIVQFLVIEDANWCVYVALPAATASLGAGVSAHVLTLQGSLQSDYTDGETCDAYPNPQKRIRYTLTPGLTSTDPDPALRYRGVFRDMAPLIRAYDYYLSAEATKLKVFQFPQPVRKRVPVMGPQGVPYSGIGDPQPQGFKAITPGSMDVLDLEVGEDLGYLSPPESLDTTRVMAQIQILADQLGLSASLKEVNGAAGYALEIASNNALLTRKPLLRGIRQAHPHRIATAHKIITDEIKEKMFVVGEGDRSSGQARWLSLSPDDLDGLSFNIETIFELRKPPNATQDLDNYERSIASGAYDEETARSKYLGEEQSERIQEARLVDHTWTQIEPAIVELGQQRAQLTIQQALQKRQIPSLTDLAGISPSLAVALQQLTPLSQPGAAPLQQFAPGPMQQPPSGAAAPSPPAAGQSSAAPPPTAPPPQAAPATPPPRGRTGGRPAGSKPTGLPPGNRMTGGMG